MNQRYILLTFPLVIVFLLACALVTARPTPATTPTDELAAATATATSSAQLSTATSPATARPTSRPTRTPLSRPTTTPLSTQAATSSPTLESPQEVSPSATASPLPTVLASSTPGPLPSSTAGAEGPAIGFFRANVEEADPGDTITLEWATSKAITVTLWQLAPTGQFSRFWDVEASGAFDYQIDPRERNQTTFALSASDGRANAPMATLAVRLRCPDNWFFASHPDICPATAALISNGAEQTFEHGFMLWVEGEDRIYVLFGDGRSPQWSAYSDEWDPSEPDRDPSLSPPPGRYQPVRGFGLVWREQPDVRQRLGWATAEEVAYGTIVQRTSYAKYNETFILAAYGRIWRLLAERSGWEQIDS